MKEQPQKKRIKTNTLIWDTEHDQNEKLRCLTYPSTAGERSGRLLPLDRYLLCVCKRGGRPGPQYSPPPRGPPRDPPSPPGTEPPNSPVPRLPDPLPPPGTRSDSGLSRSRLNGLSTNNSCHSYSERDGYKRVVQSTSLKLIEKNPHQQQLYHLYLRQERCCGRKGSTYLGKLWSCVIKAIWTTVQKTKDETITFMSDMATYCGFKELGSIYSWLSQRGSHRSKPVLLNAELHNLDAKTAAQTMTSQKHFSDKAPPKKTGYVCFHVSFSHNQANM